MHKRWLFPALLAVVLGGCSLPFGNKNVVQKVEEKAAEQTVLANCKYEKDVCQYYAAMISAYSKPMVMKTTSSMKAGETTISTTKMDGKGNMEMVSVTNGKEDSAIILLDNVSYIKDYKDNTWMKLGGGDKTTTNPLSNTQNMVESFKEEAEDIKDSMTVKKLGQEACGTLTCLKYQMEESTLGTSTIVWFDTKEHKTRKMEMAVDSYTSTMEFSYENVTITVPSPVKEMPDYSKMMEDSGVQMPSTEDIQKMMQDLPQEDGE